MFTCITMTIVVIVVFSFYRPDYQRCVVTTQPVNFVTAKSNGRLGNILFEYANAFAYAKRHNKILMYDNHDVPVLLRNLKIIDQSLIDENTYIHKEKAFHFSSMLTNSMKNRDVIFEGYYQSIKYFKDYLDEFVAMIHDNAPMNRTRLKIDVDDKRLVSVHVRRGDYVNNQTHGGCADESYFNMAIEYMKKNVKDCIFIFFSDDIDYCKKTFQADNYHFVDYSKQDYEDLLIMSDHRHHIMSNSSYSWWGTILSRKKGINIAPKQWFADKKYANFNDIYVDGWIKL